MPEGSHDRFWGIGVSVTPTFEGSRESVTRPVVDGSAQWSNGIFLNGALLPSRYDPLHPLQLGYRISPSPAIDFGPMVAIREGWPVFVARQLNTKDNAWAGSAGGFIEFNLTDDMKLTGNLLADLWSSKGAGSLIGNLDLRQTANVAAHHSVAFWGGLRWGDSLAVRNQFGVTAEQAPVTGFPVYGAKGGIEDLHLGADWRWDLSNAWRLSTALYLTRLTGSAAGSPEVQTRNNASASVTLLRRF